MPPLRILARLVAAALVVAATGLVGTPASAATCSSGTGVTVVVDFNGLGGGVRSGCVAGGAGSSASDLFPTAGFPLAYVQRQPGFVCRVSGKPADSPCVNTPPADAYWSLWWSDGRSGSWTYATSGVGGLHVPDGGYVALSWQGSTTRSQPGLAPSPHPSSAPTRTPTRTPTQAPSRGPTRRPTNTPLPPQSRTPTSAATKPSALASLASQAPSKAPDASASTESEEPGEAGDAGDPGEAASATDDSAPPAADQTDAGDPDGDGLPAWVAPVAVVVLFGAAGGVAVVRRRRGRA